MLIFLIGLMFGFIFGWLFHYWRTTYQRIDPAQYNRDHSTTSDQPHSSTEIEDLHKRYEHLQNELLEHTDREQSLHSQLTQASAQVNDLSEQLAALNHSSASQLKARDLAIDDLNAKLKQQKQAEDQQAVIENLRAELNQYQNQTQSLNNELSDKTSDLEQCKNTLTTLEDQLSVQTSELAQLRSELDTARTALSEPEPELEPEPAEAAKSASHTDLDIDALKASLPTATTEPDNLKKIKGIGAVIEKTLNELGISTFRQLALLNENQVDQVARALKVFPDRMKRDDWVSQAQHLHQEKYNEQL